ncbi:MAG: hypothetical protein O3B84_06495 [Chloroflexi bacterium]|nr:hypothetical protein [Chloroflexota bacterium]
MAERPMGAYHFHLTPREPYSGTWSRRRLSGDGGVLVSGPARSNCKGVKEDDASEQSFGRSSESNDGLSPDLVEKLEWRERVNAGLKRVIG